MAFHGDLQSYPLPELLNWLDGSRKTGALQLVGDGADRKLFLLSGHVVATASPAQWERLARALGAGGIDDGARVLTALRASRLPPGTIALEAGVLDDLKALAAEELTWTLADLTLAQAGRFHWTEDPDRGEEEWVPLDLALRHALFESLRWLDEQPDVDRVLPIDGLTVHARSAPEGKGPVSRMVLHMTRATGMTLGRLRLVLGLPRTLVARSVYELMRAGAVLVDGAAVLEPDPVAELLEKAAVLVRERQFEAALILFQALVQSDPTDRRVREFARMVEREHLAAIYAELPPLTVLEQAGAPELWSRLRADERQLANLVNGRWDVSALVLASQLGELDALKVLKKLVRLGAAVAQPR